MVWRALPAVALLVGGLGTVGSAQSVTLTAVGSIPGSAELIRVEGTRAYVTSGKTLTLVDITDPASPRRLASHTFPDLIWGLAIRGELVYVATDLSGLSILDVSDARAPVVRGSLKTPGQAKSVALAGTRALVADHVAGIDAIDVSSPARPVLLESYFVDGFAKDVVVRGALAYALDQPTGLSVFDLTKPGSIEPAATLTLTNPIPLRAQLVVSDEASTSRSRVAVVVGGGPLQIYDLTNPDRPVHAATYRTQGPAFRAALQDGRAYISDGPQGLQVVDLSVPSKPVAVGSYKTSTPARDVAVAGPLVFVTLGGDEVLILRQSQ
ncbi:MAG TPA: hypothetical protein VFV95_02900 [Vicinamibacterales bacterium]|nr:hypothetical protein [Vicinamibacterales bacterium]